MDSISVEPKGEATATVPFCFICSLIKSHDVPSTGALCFDAISAYPENHGIVA